MTAATTTKPGVYTMPEAEYHAHPALSSTGARKLLPPSCPALYAYEREHPAPPKKVFEFGHAAHQMVLGAGPEIVEVKHDSWRTNAAKDQADGARAINCVPLLTKDYEVVQAMAAALKANPVAARLFQAGSGQPEQSLFWTDADTGVECRARLDWLPNRKKTRMVVSDYKTSVSAEPEKFGRSAADYGYAQQAAWYLDAVAALGLADDAVFVHIVQEKTPPYLVTPIQLDVVALRIGRHLNQQARHLFAECTSTDTWPGYSADVALVSLPYYYERKFEDQI